MYLVPKTLCNYNQLFTFFSLQIDEFYFDLSHLKIIG